VPYLFILLGISSKLFTSYSHPLSFLPASGLRLEIAFHSDKKKPELYFSSVLKKLLTENGIPNSRGNVARECVDPAVALTQH